MSREQVGFGFSDQDVRCIDEFLTPLHQHARCLSDLLRMPPYFGGQHAAAKEMCAHTGGKIRSAARAQVRASAKGIGG